MEHTQFGRLLASIRKLQDLSLRDMAVRLNVSPSYLSSVETGKMPVTTRLLDRIFKHFNLSEQQKADLQKAAIFNLIKIDNRPDELIKALANHKLNYDQISYLSAIISNQD